MAEQIRGKQTTTFWTLWAIAASFGTYFCMYAFRKPFTVALPEGLRIHGVEMKSFLITAQVAGYMTSKFIGVKVVAELPPRLRALVIMLLIGVAELALVLFAMTPAPWSGIWLFVNGLPLGMVFGLVISFIEGRQRTELLVAALCASFILADGFTKSLGSELLALHIAARWVPAAAGAVAAPFTLLFGYMLWWIPPPSEADVIARSARTTLDLAQRRELLRSLGPGIATIVMIYLLLTIVRSIRSDFAPEIWASLHQSIDPSLYTRSELLVGAAALMTGAAVVMIHDNRKAFFVSLASSTLGFVLIVAALLLNHWHQLSAFFTMVLIGMGLYVPYVAIHTSLFERMLAMTRKKGTVGYLITFADAIGYLGYVAVLIIRQFLHQGRNVLSGHFLSICWITSAISIAGLGFAWRYFSNPPRKVDSASEVAVPTADLAGTAA